MKARIPALVSLIALTLYFLAVFIGPSGPQWPQKLEDVSDISTSNPVNQVVYSFIFLLAFISILPSYKTFFKWMNHEKYIILFFMWCATTLLWSNDATISFKRLFQYITTSLVFLSALINWRDEEPLLKIIKYVLSVYLIVSIFVVILIPQAKDPSFDTWRGLHPTKNNLGQTASICIIFFSYLLSRENNLIFKTRSLFFLFLSIILLLGSFSMTNIILIFVYMSVFIFVQSVNLFSKIGLGMKFALFMLFSSLGLIVILFLLAPDLYLAIFDLVGKDPTLTGRTEIWAIVLSSTINDLFIGVGFQAFWIPQHLVTVELFKYWIPTQSHNGYVDIILETGLVGLFLFIFAVFITLRKANFRSNLLWILFIIYAVLLNFSESTFIRPHHPTNVMLFASFWIISLKRNKDIFIERNSLIINKKQL